MECRRSDKHSGRSVLLRISYGLVVPSLQRLIEAQFIAFAFEPGRAELALAKKCTRESDAVDYRVTMVQRNPTAIAAVNDRCT